jgi:hypothetical protein
VKTFQVGLQEVKVWQFGGRWGVAVDGMVHRRWFMTEAQAAGAGLLRAQKLSRRMAGPRSVESARQDPSF